MTSFDQETRPLITFLGYKETAARTRLAFERIEHLRAGRVLFARVLTVNEAPETTT